MGKQRYCCAAPASVRYDPPPSPTSRSGHAPATTLPSASISTAGWPDEHQTATRRDVSAEIAYLTQAFKAPTLRESVARLAESARAEKSPHAKPTAVTAASAPPDSRRENPWKSSTSTTLADSNATPSRIWARWTLSPRAKTWSFSARQHQQNPPGHRAHQTRLPGRTPRGVRHRRRMGRPPRRRPPRQADPPRTHPTRALRTAGGRFMPIPGTMPMRLRVTDRWQVEQAIRHHPTDCPNAHRYGSSRVLSCSSDFGCSLEESRDDLVTPGNDIPVRRVHHSPGRNLGALRRFDRMRQCGNVLTICQSMSRLHSLGKPEWADALVGRPEQV